MSLFPDNRNDTVVLMLSIFAVLMSGLLSIATLTSRAHQEQAIESADPFWKAEAAAKAGIEAAKWHMECHGRVNQGGLAARYYLNGAMYSVQWDNMNGHDSTVTVHSEGYIPIGAYEHYKVTLDSKIKLTFLPSHKQEILGDYYSRNGQPAFSEK